MIIIIGLVLIDIGLTRRYSLDNFPPKVQSKFTGCFLVIRAIYYQKGVPGS